MNTQQEFATIDLILNTSLETRAVDSFALSIIKLERQVRRIFCFLIYQHPNLGDEDTKMLSAILSKNRNMYFENFINGITLIYGANWKAEYGPQFNNDFDKLRIYQMERNKIFHGQTTLKKLNREQLIERVIFIKDWCLKIEVVFESKIGFNGFNRNSFQKSNKKIELLNSESFKNYNEFKNLLKEIGR